MNVIYLPSRHYAGRWGRKVKYIIVHSTASPSGDPWLTTPPYLVENPRGVSSHELAMPGENVYILVTDERAAQHCWSKVVQFPGGEHYNLANQITWGIEGYQLAGRDTPPEVVRLMVERVALACLRFDLERIHVLGHKEIDPTRKSDPVGVDMEWFRQRVGVAINRLRS